MKNWSSILLLNVAQMIGSKTFSSQIRNTQPDKIHEDQCAFIKGRTIFDALRSFDDVVESKAREFHYKLLNRIVSIK